jgi:hypothetical protein
MNLLEENKPKALEVKEDFHATRYLKELDRVQNSGLSPANV